MNKNSHPNNGCWLIDTTTPQITWLGRPPAPKPTLNERLNFALSYIRSNGNGPRFIDIIKRSAKAVAFLWKPAQVSRSGKPYVTTGRSLEEEWAKFKLTECVRPHSGHGKADIFDANSSN